GEAGPGDFRIGGGNGRNLAGVEDALLSARDLGGDMAFMHRLVSEHGLADDVANGKDVRDVGAHLLVDFDETALGNGDAGLFSIDEPAVGRAAERDAP